MLDFTVLLVPSGVSSMPRHAAPSPACRMLPVQQANWLAAVGAALTLTCEGRDEPSKAEQEMEPVAVFAGRPAAWQPSPTARATVVVYDEAGMFAAVEHFGPGREDADAIIRRALELHAGRPASRVVAVLDGRLHALVLAQSIAHRLHGAGGNLGGPARPLGA